ncbi:glycosyltransferase, partial [Francisella tularensis]|uniref:glycosyltransferase n=1 Tax=Francisella tularensis TaxID=263 RepID=UPI002381B911
GVDTQVFYPAENRQQPWQDKKIPGKYGIGVFGRLRKTKGTQEFIEAAIVTLKKYPDWTAVFIGEATPRDLDFKKELAQKLKQAGLDKQIIFIGFIADS